MKKLNLEIDLSGVNSSGDIFDRFNQILNFEYPFGPVKEMNWDSFDDLLWGINLHSQTIQEAGANGVHLVIHNLSAIKNYSEEDLHLLCEILAYSTMNRRFDGRFDFSFEVGKDQHMVS